MNAQENLRTIMLHDQLKQFQLSMAKGQLKNSIELLEKGYGIDELIEPLLEEHGSIENVPELEPTNN